MLWRGGVRARICRASNTKLQQLRRFAVDRLMDRDVTSKYYDKLESELQGVQAQQLSLNEKCKKLEVTILRVATNTIGYTRKQANKELFDEECAKRNEEKNGARERAIQTKTRGAKKSLQTCPDKREKFVEKKGKAARRRGFNRD
jgi:hypothetical protein